MRLNISSIVGRNEILFIEKSSPRFLQEIPEVSGLAPYRQAKVTNTGEGYLVTGELTLNCTAL